MNLPNSTVAPGEHLRTGDDGEIDLDVGVGVVHVQPKSEVVFARKGAAAMKLRNGKAGLRLDRLPKGERFRIETPQASMGVRGTTLAVQADATTRVAVEEGSVEIGELVVEAARAAEKPADAPAAGVNVDVDERAVFERLRLARTVPRFDWVRLPGGTFTMGEKGASYAFATPPHPVTVPAFEMGRVEVTNAQFRVFWEWIEETGDHHFCHPDEPADFDHRPWMEQRTKSAPAYFHDDDQPVSGVSWYSAYAFAAWAGVRLPSEAEWEYAARAGATTPWPWGESVDLLPEYEWYRANSGDKVVDYDKPPEGIEYGSNDHMDWIRAARRRNRCRPHSVGTKLPNRFGLHDMLGNVSEFVRDWYRTNYRGAPADGSAWLDRKTAHKFTGSGKPRPVSRGGSFRTTWDGSSNLPTYTRSDVLPARSDLGVGLRVARSITR